MPRLHSLVLLCLLSGSLAAQETSSTPGPEAEVLARLAGRWKVSVELKPAAWTPQGRRFDETKTTERILGGRFVEEVIESADHEGRAIYGFDPMARVYRGWHFLSDGSTSDWSGKWDAVAKTLTWKMDRQDLDAVAVHRFESPDRFVYTVTIKSESGEILMDAHAVHERVKD